MKPLSEMFIPKVLNLHLVCEEALSLRAARCKAVFCPSVVFASSNEMSPLRTTASTSNRITVASAVTDAEAMCRGVQPSLSAVSFAPVFRST